MNIIKRVAKMRHFLLLQLALCMGMGSALADVVVIGHPGLAVDSVSANEAKKIWLGKTSTLGGETLKVADLPKDAPARGDFYSGVVNKNESQLKAYWAKIVFSGKGTPPKEFGSPEDVVGWVAANPGAVGYVDSAAVNESVKVLFSGE